MITSIIQDWLNSFWITACFVLHFIYQWKQSDECSWRRMSLPSRNLYKCKQVVYCYLCILFTLSLLIFYLFIPSFYTDVIFLFIIWSCKQDHCFVFVAFVYHFNNTYSIFVIIFYNNLNTINSSIKVWIGTKVLEHKCYLCSNYSSIMNSVVADELIFISNN